MGPDVSTHEEIQKLGTHSRHAIYISMTALKSHAADCVGTVDGEAPDSLQVDDRWQTKCRFLDTVDTAYFQTPIQREIPVYPGSI